jgi:hypothetical protein
MDQDLVAEVARLHEVYLQHGLQVFRYACFDSWIAPSGTKSQSPLFRACTPSGREECRDDGQFCGCLVEVRSPQYPTGPRVAWNDALTEAIRADDRIPKTMAEIRPEQLDAFAEWQQAMRTCFKAG